MVLDIDGFISQLSVELFAIVPEGLVLPEEARPFGVSPESLCFGLDLFFSETYLLWPCRLGFLSQSSS